MKMSRPMKMPMPTSKTVKMARAIAGIFAHHMPSTIPKTMPKMERPTGGKGPRNPME